MAIIFHHDRFDHDNSATYQLAERKSSASERDKLAQTLTNLEFKVETVENLTWDEIQKKMEYGKLSLEYSKDEGN